MFNLGLPPFQHQTPDPCPKSYTLNLQTPNTYSESTVILTAKTEKHISVSFRVVLVSVGTIISHWTENAQRINGKTTVTANIGCNKGELHFILDYNIVVIKHRQITVRFTDMRNSLRQVCIKYDIKELQRRSKYSIKI